MEVLPSLFRRYFNLFGKLETILTRPTEVLERISNAGITLKLSKCAFGNSLATFPGHLIAKGSISPDPANIKAIQDFPQPNSVTAIRSFLGMAGHYQRYIQNLAGISHPLTKIIHLSSGKKNQRYRSKNSKIP